MKSLINNFKYSVFIVCLLAVNLSAVCQKKGSKTNCIDFEGSKSTSNWITKYDDNFVDGKEIVSYPNDPFDHTQVIRFTDGEGASVAVNNTDFAGNWLLLGKNGCLCFDYKVDWKASAGSDAGSAAKFQIYTGPAITSVNTNGDATSLFNSIRAYFVGNTANPILQDNVWGKFCLPIGLCSGGQLPYNNYGTWGIRDATGPLTGAAACTAWDNLIMNVTGVVLPIDYNDNASELVYFDNFCWNCTENPKPKPCCDIPGLDVSLTETSGAVNLTVSGGTTAIQEVTVSMMDYHAEYSNPDCKPANIGMPGKLSSTTTSLGTLTFDGDTNNSQSLSWVPSSPGGLNNQQINLSVTKPLVLQIPCCEVKFYYCLKVRVKDINCNVCEKIVCSKPGDINPACDCGKKWDSNSNISYADINGKKHDTKIDCFAKFPKGPMLAGSNITYTASAYQCNKPDCIASYSWKIIDFSSNSIVNSATAISLPISFPAPSGAGKFEFIVYATCGGHLCDSCAFYFTTEENPDCKCNDKASFDVSFGDGTKGTIKCGETITAAYLSTLTFSPVGLCIPKECLLHYKYEVRDLQTDAFVSTQSMTGNNPFSITMNSLAGYKIKIKYDCNGKACKCEFFIRTKKPDCPKFRANIKSIQCHDPLVANNYNFKIFIDNNETSSTGTFTLTSVTAGMSINSYSPTTVNPISSAMVTGTASGSGTTLCIKVTFTAGLRTCDTTICFTLPICGPNPCSCKGNWKSDIITYTGGGISDSVGCKKSKHLLGAPSYTFTAPAYSCSPSDSSCLPIYTWSVKGVQKGTGSTFTYQFTEVDNHVTVKVSCGGKACDSCYFDIYTTISGTCCPVVCDKSLNHVFDNAPLFASTLISSQTINFSKNYDGTAITNPTSQTGWGQTWQWNDITFNNISSFNNLFIETLPFQSITINFPPCKYKNAGFDLSLFNGAPLVGNYTIKVSSCDCIYTYVLTGNQAYYFGINLPTAIDKIEVAHIGGNLVIDNFSFGN